MTSTSTIVIRTARDSDAAGLERLARLDAALVPTGDLLVAEADGELRAALRIADGAFFADPFHPTRDLVELLETRAGRLRQQHFTLPQRVRTRFNLWAELWQRAATVRPSQ